MIKKLSNSLPKDLVTKRDLQASQRDLKRELKQDLKRDFKVEIHKAITASEKRLQAQIADSESRMRVWTEVKFQEFEEKIDRKLNKKTDQIARLIDTVLLEIRDMRMEHATNTQNIPSMRDQLEDHETRLESLEKVALV